ncbi:hypothetical protein TNCV_450671 [Trichonephila clavipes]|nr:hypothetical protein TNCV_450671 [Trichonephila clavipes]
MATGSFTSPNYSSSQSEVLRDHYKNLGGRTGTILLPSSVPLSSKNQEINRLQLAVKFPWAILYENRSSTLSFSP